MSGSALRSHEHEAAEAGEAEHPSVFIQVHRPDGTPVACGNIDMTDEEDEGY